MFVFCFVVLSFAEYVSVHDRSFLAWRIEFVDPTSKDLSFQMQNDGQARTFRYVVYVNKRPMHEGNVAVGTGEIKTFPQQDLIDQGAVFQGKVRIHMEDPQGGVREIFKIL